MPAGGVQRFGVPAGPRPEVDAAAHPTEVLDPAMAGSQADPGARTEVIPRDRVPVVAVTEASPPAAPGRPLLTRGEAAEVGLYAGAALVAVSVGGTIARAWPDWDTTMRVASVALAAVALVAAGLFVRLPWSRRAGDVRRRGVSVMLTAGAGLAMVGSGAALDVRQGAVGSPAVAHAVACLAGMLVVCVIARSPVAELGLLGSAAWAIWILVPAPLLWAGLVGVGCAWSVLGLRWARGRRTAGVSGAGLALAASVGLAQGAWAWPVRGGLAALAAGGLAAFLRGGPNAWLALGAGAATALAASVAGDRVGPVLALLVGGLATMAVSGVALRAARRAG